MDNWQHTEDLVAKHTPKPSPWLRLTDDGDKALVIFLGEPYPWEIEAAGLVRLFPAINVALYESSRVETWEVKAFACDIPLFKDLIRVRDKYNLDAWVFEIQRHGGSFDPSATWSLLPEQQLSPEERQNLSTLPLHDLEALCKEETE